MSIHCSSSCHLGRLMWKGSNKHLDKISLCIKNICKYLCIQIKYLVKASAITLVMLICCCKLLSLFPDRQKKKLEAIVFFFTVYSVNVLFLPGNAKKAALFIQNCSLFLWCYIDHIKLKFDCPENFFPLIIFPRHFKGKQNKM